MEQKKTERTAYIEARDNIQVQAVKQLLDALDSHRAEQLSVPLQQQLMGSDGLQPDWQAEMVRLKRLRTPVNDVDF
jgi:hypothetical protein